LIIIGIGGIWHIIRRTRGTRIEASSSSRLNIEMANNIGIEQDDPFTPKKNIPGSKEEKNHKEMNGP
jgi:hypothetical protein